MLSNNYIALSMVPLIVELFQHIFDNHTADYPYFLNAGLLSIVFIICLLKRRSFVWTTVRGEESPVKMFDL